MNALIPSPRWLVLCKHMHACAPIILQNCFVYNFNISHSAAYESSVCMCLNTNRFLNKNLLSANEPVLGS